MLDRVVLGVERILRATGKTAPDLVRKVLFVEHQIPLGCVVHQTPVYEAIKQARPEVEITVATRGLGLQVLRHSRFVDQLIETSDPTKTLARAALELRRELRRRAFRPDCVLTGAGDQRTWIALMELLGADGWRGGFTQSPGIYQRPLKYDYELSLIGNNLRLAGLVGCETTQTIEPKVFFSERELATAKRLLATANPEGKPVVVMVTQNSGGQSTGWHTDRFVEVIRAADECGLAVVYVGTAGDAAAIEAIRRAAGWLGASIAGKTTVSELAAVLAASDFVVSLDTGTMHVGRAVGVPMVVLGPSWQKPLEWMPLGVENVRILRGEDRVGAPEGYRLDEISAASVRSALADLMAIYPASDEARERRLQAGLSSIDHLAGR